MKYGTNFKINIFTQNLLESENIKRKFFLLPDFYDLYENIYISQIATVT